MKCYICQKEIKDNQKSGYHSIFAMVDKNGGQVRFHEKCMLKINIKDYKEEINTIKKIIKNLEEQLHLI